MSTLNKALKDAANLGGTIREFDQGQLNFCTGFAARWIKYQLLGKGDQFWSNPGRAEKRPIWSTRNAAEPYRLTAAGTDKFRKAHSEADQQDKHGYKKAGFAANTYLMGRFNKPSKLAGEPPLAADSDFFGKPPDPDDVEALGRDIKFLIPNRAMHISLQPRTIDSFASFHSTAAFNIAGREQLYFDPNMGEVRLPIDEFPKWWQIYMNAWKSDKTYSLFKKYVGTVFNGEADLAREARKRRQKLADMAASAAASAASSGAAATAAAAHSNVVISDTVDFDKLMAEMAALQQELEAIK